MKYFFFSILCSMLMAAPALSQDSWRAASYKYFEHRDKEEGRTPDSMLYYARLAQEIAEREHGLTHRRYFISRNLVACYYNDETDQADSAKQIWRQLYGQLKDLHDTAVAKEKADVYQNLYEQVYTYEAGQPDSTRYFAGIYLQEEKKQKNTRDYLEILVNVAYTADKQGDSLAAKRYYQEALEYKRKLWGEASARISPQLDSLLALYATGGSQYDFRYSIYMPPAPDQSWKELDSLAAQYSRENKLYNALDFALMAKDVALKEKGANSNIFCNATMRFSSIIGEWPGCDTVGLFFMHPLLKKLEAEKKTNTLLYADALATTGNLHHESRSKEALKYLYKALTAYQRLAGKNKQYIETLEKIAWRYINSSARDYDLAMAKMREAFSLAEKIYSKKDPRYLQHKKPLAAICLTMGKLDEAEKLTLEVYDAYVKNFNPSPTDEELLSLSQKLGYIYSYRAQPSKEIHWFGKALEIIEARGDTTSWDYPNLNNNLFDGYVNIGLWEKAKQHLDKAERYFQLKSDTSSDDYSFFLSNKFSYYIQQKDYAAAEALLPTLFAIRGLTATTYQDDISKMNLRHVYWQGIDLRYRQGNYAGTLQLATELKALLTTAGMDSVASSTDLYKTMGECLMRLGQPDSAMQYYRLALYTSKTGEQKIYHYQTDADIAVAHWRIGEKEKAETLLSSAANQVAQYTITNMAGFSEQEKQSYMQTLNDIIHKYYNLHHQSGLNAASDRSAFNLALLAKGLLLQSSLFIKNQIEAGGNASLKKLYANLLTTKKELAKAYQQGEKQAIDSLQNLADKTEKKLSEQSTVYKDYLRSTNIGFKEVQASLKKNEAAIEFISFPYFNGYEFTDSTICGAFVARPSMQAPAYVALPQATEVARYVQRQGVAGRGAGEEEVAVDGSTFSNLYEAVWAPLQKHLGDATTIKLAPDGILNKVAFAALKDSAGNYLADRYALHTLLSTKDLATNKTVSVGKQFSDILLFGGARYDGEALSAQEETDRSLPRALVGNTAWNYLPGTLEEVRTVAQLLQNLQWKVSTHTGNKASEKTFKEVIDSTHPSILHIATHGFYFPKENTAAKQSTVYREADDPMLRCGLVFSGANNAWMGKGVPAGEEDGILTAMELATLDLSSTDLVVLSACETGVGEIQNGEGVIGLQRALRQAGVANMIVSLWSVPDMETSEMMQYFYNALAKEKNIAGAFATARKKMRNKYPDNPSLWAGFTLIE